MLIKPQVGHISGHRPPSRVSSPVRRRRLRPSSAWPCSTTAMASASTPRRTRGSREAWARAPLASSSAGTASRPGSVRHLTLSRSTTGVGKTVQKSGGVSPEHIFGFGLTDLGFLRESWQLALSVVAEPQCAVPSGSGVLMFGRRPSGLWAWGPFP